jgi:Tol biopolymer transport system component
MQRLGGSGDCQVAWARDRRSVFFVGRGGRQHNALYTLVPGGRAELWLDLPGDLSHEYFPRQSADGRFLVFAASAGGREHEHDAGDYELFLWRVGDPGEKAVRLTHHTGNDSWPDLYLFPE